MEFTKNKFWKGFSDRHYVSFDTPHQGANVPIALQEYAFIVTCNTFPMFGCPNVQRWDEIFIY